jgi:chlorobactene glucosyltransferase
LSHLWVSLQFSIVAVIGVLFTITMSNMRTLQRLGDYPIASHLPGISILVPARNEEANILPCVRSLIAQEYPRLEVLVLDDNSDDATRQVLAPLVAEDSRLRVLAGEPLPPGWVGKNWACHQLARAASSDFLLFTDADTRHDPKAAAEAMSALLGQDADLLTAFPRQEAGSLFEKLVVPVLTWAFVLFLPLRLAYRSSRPGLSIAIGQFMLFRRRGYEQIGGHASVQGEVIEDLALARKVKEHGLRWRLVDGSGRVRCRMYRGPRQAFEGVSKNLFPGFQYHVPRFALSLGLIALLTLQPVAVLLSWLGGARLSGLSVGLAATAIGLSLALTGVSYRRHSFSPYLMFLYPVTAVVMLGIGVCSLVLALLGRHTWKGRRLFRPKARWW